MRSTPPMPFHVPNDRATDPNAGSQTSQSTRSAGTATISDTTMRSVVLRRRRRVGVAEEIRLVVVAGVADVVIGCPSHPVSSTTEDRFLLLLDALGEPVDVVGILQEGLQRRDHDGRGEVGVGVTVQELRDVCR